MKHIITLTFFSISLSLSAGIKDTIKYYFGLTSNTSIKPKKGSISVDDLYAGSDYYNLLMASETDSYDDDEYNSVEMNSSVQQAFDAGCYDQDTFTGRKDIEIRDSDNNTIYRAVTSSFNGDFNSTISKKEALAIIKSLPLAKEGTYTIIDRSGSRFWSWFGMSRNNRFKVKLSDNKIFHPDPRIESMLNSGEHIIKQIQATPAATECTTVIKDCDGNVVLEKTETSSLLSGAWNNQKFDDILSEVPDLNLSDTTYIVSQTYYQGKKHVRSLVKTYPWGTTLDKE